MYSNNINIPIIFHVRKSLLFHIITTFKKLNLKIVIESNMKIVNFLDITLNLSDGSFSPYRKPNDESLHINYVKPPSKHD